MPPSTLTLDRDITLFSSFRTPARARYFFEIRSNEDLDSLAEIYHFSKENNLPLVFLGGGTNVLFAFDVFEGIIVRNLLKGIEYSENTVTVASGELVTPFSLHLFKQDETSLYGKWIGLPGTVGGAVAGNAGCFGFETKDVVTEGKFLNLETGEYFTLGNAEFDFSYRHSILKSHPEWFLVNATFRTDLKATDDTDPRTFRSSKQPGGFTCGSFFRNPSGDSAGRLIDSAGLKGTAIGGAKISELHANFFIHDGKGSYEDILRLRDLAKGKVRELYGVELQEEVRIIG